MAGERSNPPRVTETIVFRENIEPYDDFGYIQKEPPLPALPRLAESRACALGGDSNITQKPQEGAVCAFARRPRADTPDYTSQLEFHQYELDHAEQRGFPPGQVAYHLARLNLLKGLL